MVNYLTEIIITVLVIYLPPYVNGHNVDWYVVIKERKGNIKTSVWDFATLLGSYV